MIGRNSHHPEYLKISAKIEELEFEFENRDEFKKKKDELLLEIRKIIQEQFQFFGINIREKGEKEYDKKIK